MEKMLDPLWVVQLDFINKRFSVSILLLTKNLQGIHVGYSIYIAIHYIALSEFIRK